MSRAPDMMQLIYEKEQLERRIRWMQARIKRINEKINEWNPEK